MAKYCGGIALGEGLKLLNGVICDTNAQTVDVSKTVSHCGQLWDGALFKAIIVDGYKIITLHSVDGEEVGEPIVTKGNCGVGLDGRFFKLVNRKVNLQDGFVLTVVTDPETASVKVVDADNVEIQPITENGKTFLLSGLGDSYGVNVEKEGYTGKHLTIVNNKDQVLNVELVEIPQG